MGMGMAGKDRSENEEQDEGMGGDDVSAYKYWRRAIKP